MKHPKIPVLAALLLGGPPALDAQSDAYLDFDDLTRELRSLAGASDVVRLQSAGTSLEGREIWVVEIGDPAGAPLAERPALLVVGNLEGDHLVGSALALEIIRYMADVAAGRGDLDAEAREEARAILARNTLYVFPRLNPDGAEARFGRVLWERRGNGRPHDDDNDGRTDEDGPEDLNGDGLITVMRVADPSGAYMVEADEPRLLKRADPAKGEQGAYTLYWEGTDSDGDGFYNEDGAGGVDLNRNFQHAYPYYEADAGPHMVSEPESRALMDFAIAHRNIAAVLAFGHTDNLVTPPDSRGNLADPRVLDLAAFADASWGEIFDKGVFQTGPVFGFGGFGGFFPGGGGGGPRLRGAQPGRDNDPDSGRRPATTVNAADQEYFKAVSESYKEITGIEKVGLHREPEGAFFQFGYFQFGVPSFSTPGWALPSTEAEEEEAAEPGAGGEAAAGAAAEGEAPQRRAGVPTPGAAGPRRVVVVEEGGAPPMARQVRPGGQARGGGRGPGGAAEAGLDAELLEAMDAAGIDAFVDWQAYSHPTLGEVEIGGFLPYATTNPPAADLPRLGRAHGEFAVRLAGMLPRVRIVDTAVTAHGGGVFTVEAEVENRGYFPTASQHGVVSRSVHPVMVQIQVPPEVLITGDPKSATVRQLEGSGGRERWLWVIRGQPGSRVEIRALSQKGGTDTATVTLR